MPPLPSTDQTLTLEHPYRRDGGAKKGRAGARRRRRVTWKRAVLGLLLVLVASLALPDVRNALVDAVLYNPQNILPVSAPATVERQIHTAWGTVSVPVAVERGTVQHYTFTSSILSRAPTRDIYVYLPPGYASPANAGRRYPVVYLLHGAPGGPRDWTRGAHADIIADEMLAQGLINPMILVMPDGNGGQWRDTEYVNKFNGRDNEMTYLVRGVVPWVDRHFRTIPTATGRALGGMSMGGYGAYNVGLHYPRVWRTLFSISGYFAADRGEVFGANDPLGHSPRFWRANSPTAYIGRSPSARHMHLLIEESTADWGGYTEKALAFDRLLTRLKIPHTLDMHHPTGLTLWDHSWSYWQLALRHALIYSSANFGR